MTGVCCPVPGSGPQTPVEPPPEEPELTEEEEEEFEIEFQTINAACGATNRCLLDRSGNKLNPLLKIVNGQEACTHEFPFMVCLPRVFYF